MAVDMNMNVLIVDENKTMLRDLLRQLGFMNIEEASYGRQALQMLHSGSDFGLVISDWDIKPMNGLQLLREVRADPKLKPTPFILVNADSKLEDAIAAKEAGVSNYIVKPFNAETLKGKMVSVLGYF